MGIAGFGPCLPHRLRISIPLVTCIVVWTWVFVFVINVDSDLIGKLRR